VTRFACATLLSIICAAFGAPPAIAGDLPTPDVYCKAHPLEPKCIDFLGSSSRFNSQSGNVGNVRSVRANSQYIIFLHAGGGGMETAEKISKDLQGRGFTVRGIDQDIDRTGGPGVDYFNEQDRSAASDVAAIASAAIPGTAPLVPRFQNVANPTGFLGVWLFRQ
jgi:hypothetical protein